MITVWDKREGAAKEENRVTGFIYKVLVMPYY